jgi:hypothetical protein
MYKRAQAPCIHRPDFENYVFIYALFYAKNRPLYVNFSIPLSGK